MAFLSLVAWIYLLTARGGFWRAAERDGGEGAPSLAGTWPAVAAVVPARDEADLVAEAVDSLLRQNYPGSFRVVLVDDQSSDGTADAARAGAVAAGAADRLSVLSGRPLPAGWTGKLWALKQGIDHIEASMATPEYLLLTDADIAYSTDTLARLVARASAADLSLVSLMAKLRCESSAERALVPAFIFFFQMLFPFRWVNRPDRDVAAAAGGCMLVRHHSLRAAGGIQSIRGALIDDCALARRLKAQGPIRLELTERVRSLRPYRSAGDVRRMVARSAYAQLRCSPLLLARALLGMGLIYLAPPLLTLFGTGGARLMAAGAWLLMALAFQPMLRFYRVAPLWGAALPVIAAAYLAFTLDSAYQHWRGHGGMWKGRAQAHGTEAR